MTDWIEWKGGSRPTEYEVEVMLRNGVRSKNQSRCYDWRHFGTDVTDGDSDIIAYRIHKESNH
ncbi:hypothetical protein [Mesorhizobium sp. LSHC414A00]|uniref:hypothetical protein n=1 Tax=Mesorhizobium sp. LSHC414A00 TaxID=1287287 RepID=UPI0003CDE3C9|nr:hypothetical protein [Mesorhizobium sp. LSHC414A00]ESX78474.1 hypothetical protein X757_08875 [Mesorhizobium sp. LSHC414A00]